MTGARTCPTCGSEHPGRYAECDRCRAAWRKTKRHGLPTVELFPHLAPPAPATQETLNLED